MNKNEVKNKLFDDVSHMELPPISEKVRQAVREQKQKNTETLNDTFNTETSHKIINIKFIFAAAILILAVSVPVIVFVINNSVSVKPVHNPVQDSSKISALSESETTSTADSENVLEHIKSEQLYGEVGLSYRSEKYLEKMLITYSESSTVYEDDNYIYNFDSQGRLVEMLNISPYKKFDKSVSEQEILNKAKELLEKYYPYWEEDTYSIKVEENEDCNPAWIVCFTKTNEGITKEKIIMSFVESGDIKSVIITGTDENVGKISNAEAVDITLKEIRSGKYNISSFRNEDVEITVNIKEIDGQQYYYVIVSNIPFGDNIMTKGVIGIVNAETGDVRVVE